MEIYCGTQPPPGVQISNSTKDVALQLIKDIVGSGRNLITDVLPLLSTLPKHNAVEIGQDLQKKNKNYSRLQQNKDRSRRDGDTDVINQSIDTFRKY